MLDLDTTPVPRHMVVDEAALAITTADGRVDVRVVHAGVHEVHSLNVACVEPTGTFASHHGAAGAGFRETLYCWLRCSLAKADDMGLLSPLVERYGLPGPVVVATIAREATPRLAQQDNFRERMAASIANGYIRPLAQCARQCADMVVRGSPVFARCLEQAAARHTRRQRKEEQRMAVKWHVAREPQLHLDPWYYNRGGTGTHTMAWTKFPELDDFIRHHVGMGSPYKLIARRLGIAASALHARLTKLKKSEQLPTRGHLSAEALGRLQDTTVELEIARERAGIALLEVSPDVLADIRQDRATYEFEHGKASVGEQAAAAPPEPKPEPTNGKHVPAAAAALPAASVAPGADDGRQLSVLRDIARRMYQAVTDVAHGLEPDGELRSELLQMCEDWQVELEPVCPVVDRKALLREFESLSDDDLLSLRDLIQGRT